MKLNRLLLLSIIIIAVLSIFILPGCGKAPSSSTAPETSAGQTTPSLTTPGNTTTVVAPENLTVLSILGGEIRVAEKGSNDWKNGEEGTTLEIGDQIRTDAGGKALITFFDGSIIQLENDTEISIVELGTNPNQTTEIKLRQEVGTTISRVTKLLDPGDRYEIETSSAVATVRGSIMLVRTVRIGPTFVGNIEGRVFVTAQGIEVELPEGTHSTVQPGAPPTAPEPGATPPAVTTTSSGTATSSTTTAISTSTTTTSASTTTTTASSATTSTTTTTSSPTTTTSTTTRPPLTVTITSLNAGDLIEQTQTVTVSGIVSDPSISGATLTVNGVSSTIPVFNGQFGATVALSMGINNTITVSVTRDGETASDTRVLELETAQ